MFVFSKFPELPQKQENLCDIEVYYSLNHDIGTLASWSQKRTVILFIFFFFERLNQRAAQMPKNKLSFTFS